MKGNQSENTWLKGARREFKWMTKSCIHIISYNHLQIFIHNYLNIVSKEHGFKVQRCLLCKAHWNCITCPKPKHSCIWRLCLQHHILQITHSPLGLQHKKTTSDLLNLYGMCCSNQHFPTNCCLVSCLLLLLSFPWGLYRKRLCSIADTQSCLLFLLLQITHIHTYSGV